MKEVGSALEWAKNGSEGLYKEGEEEISKNGWYSFLYIRNHLKGRFLIGEEGMKASDIVWNAYKGFLKDRGIEV